MKKNICIISRDRSFAKKVGYAYACNYDMFYIDVDDMVEYELIDAKQAMKVVGTDYIDKIRRGQIRHICNFENTLYSISLATFNLDNALIKKNSLVVYLNKTQNYKNSINIINSKNDEHIDKIKDTIFDIVVDVHKNSVKEAIIALDKSIGEYCDEKNGKRQ